MTQSSANLTLPLIQPAQAQKHITHNEAIVLLDVIVQLRLESCDTQTPPTAPQDGQSWHIGETPVGDWIGSAGMIATWSGGGWLMFSPADGWRAFDVSRGEMRVYSSGTWGGLRVSSLRLTPQSTPPIAVAGDLYFDDATNTARCFDGTVWRDLY